MCSTRLGGHQLQRDGSGGGAAERSGHMVASSARKIADQDAWQTPPRLLPPSSQVMPGGFYEAGICALHGDLSWRRS